MTAQRRNFPAIWPALLGLLLLGGLAFAPSAPVAAAPTGAAAIARPPRLYRL